MPTKGQLTGMRGVYLAAAELVAKGFIVSPTSRSAAGADLLVTDQKCHKAWSVQVKTQKQALNYWLVGDPKRIPDSPSHIYIFINLDGEKRPDYLVVPSCVVSQKAYTEVANTGSTWHCFDRISGKEFIESKGWPDKRREGWEIFEDPS